VHIWAHDQIAAPPAPATTYPPAVAFARRRWVAPGWDDPWIDPSSGSPKPRSKARKHPSGVAHLTEVSTSRERKTRHRSPARMRSRLPRASRPLSGRRDGTTPARRSTEPRSRTGVGHDARLQTITALADEIGLGVTKDGPVRVLRCDIPDCGSGGRWFESTQLYQPGI
jgi:hypothetical protein